MVDVRSLIEPNGVDGPKNNRNIERRIHNHEREVRPKCE